jgi:hypothetical protein
MRWGCIGLVFLLVLAIAAIFYLRVNFKNKYTPEQWSQIQAAESEVVTLPPQWHQPATLPPMEVVTFHNSLQTSVTNLISDYDTLMFGDYAGRQSLIHRLRTGETLSADEETSFSKLLTELQPILDETSRTVQLPGYTAEMDLYSDHVISLTHQTFAKLACIAGLDHMRRGNPTAALDTMALGVRLMERPPQSQLITHLIAVAVGSIVSPNMAAVADQTTDTAALKYGLELLAELKPLIYHKEMDNWRYSDSVGGLGRAAAHGYPTDLEPQTLVEYYEQSAAFGPYYWDWIVKNLPADDLRVRNASARLQMYRRPAPDYDKMFSGSTEEFEEANEEWEAAPDNKLEIPAPQDPTSFAYKAQTVAGKAVLGVHPYAMLHALALPNVEEALTRAKISLSSFELTRIYFALRLAEAEPSLSDVTAYLSPVPADPFTSASFLFSGKWGGVHYSVGPDTADDKAAVIYDATNGTFSTGDLWVAPE